MGNSPLVSHTKLSPNHSGKRIAKIDTITPHCVVGHLSLQTLGNEFASKAKQASSNYGIDDKGKIGMFVEEHNRSWCTSSNANDQRAVTIEIASDLKHPYKITDGAMEGLIRLSVDICQRNEIPKLLWKADKKLIGQIDKQNLTVHRWFKNTICPGDYIFGQLFYVADEVNKILLKKPPTTKVPYKIMVDVPTLSYRKGPGIDNVPMGVIRMGEVYTIVEEQMSFSSSKWGKLKSGAGWVPLDLCKKVE